MTSVQRSLIRRLGNLVMPLPAGSLATSISTRCRAQRFSKFEQLTNSMPRPIRIVDIGGSPQFWAAAGWAGRADVHITLVNLFKQPGCSANMCSIVADAADLGRFPDQCFDIAFSNSVIEHLITKARQDSMVSGMRRIARALWLQTPNYWFPIEPHFYVPTWQWWPVSMRVAMLRRMRCGCRGRVPDSSEARRLVEEVRLLSGRELRRMFPTASVVPERVAGLTKSWIVYEGFDTPSLQLRQAA